MKIAIDIQDVNRIGGLERVAANLSTEMAKRGHEITMFTYSPSGSLPLFKLSEGMQLIYYIFTGEVSSIKSLQDKIIKIKPDVFVSLSSFNNILFWALILQNTGIPLLYSEHNNPWIIEKERWDKKERHAMLRAVDGIHLLMPSYIESIPLSLRSKCSIIGNTVSYPKEIFSHKNKRFCLLSLGRLSKVKQIPILIQAFSILADDFPDWDLHIWGVGEEEKKINKKINDLKCERIYMHGIAKCPNEQFRNADIFCIPSRFEGFPLTVIESFGYGVPVIGFTECSGVNELIHDGVNGALAKNMTAESLAKTLYPIMKDGCLRQKLGSNARQTALQYAPEVIYDQWEALLYSIAKHKNQTQLQLLKNKNLLNLKDRELYDEIQKLFSRKNILLKNHQVIRRFVKRHPNIKNFIKSLLRKFQV